MNMFDTVRFSVRYAACVALAMCMSMLTGCQLHPVSPSQTYPPAKGSGLLITEVFTLNPDAPYAYSWIEVTNPTQKQIAWYDTTKPFTIFMVGDGGTIGLTGNSGVTWHTSSGAAPGNLHAIQLFQYDTAYAVGDGGAIYLTQDSGKTFSQVNPANITDVNGDPVTANLNDLDIVSVYDKVNNKLGFAFGDNGTILATQDAGHTWTGKTTNTTANLHAFSHISVQEEYVVGDAGTILRTTNIGFVWNKFNSPRAVDLYGVSSTLLGGASGGAESTWVCGAQGNIFHCFTTSGSGGVVSFIAETTKVAANLYGVFFLQGGFGWAVGDSGVIINTTDDGRTWFRESAPVSSKLNKVFFEGRLRGWIFGDNGVILSTQNGGFSWDPEFSGTSSNINGELVWPTNEALQSVYMLRMLANRKQFYVNLSTGTINYNYFTHIDTGYVFYVPTVMSFSGGSSGAPPLQPGAFTVFESDSAKFGRHYLNTPPSSTYFDGTAATLLDLDTVSNPKFVEWTLLQKGEVALLRLDLHLNAQGDVIQDDTTLIDLVRYGGYRPHPDPYPNNNPSPAIPEYWSLARYQNDVGSPYPQKLNTAASFYLCDAPLPGWPSQLRK